MDRYWPERITIFVAFLIGAALLFLGSGAPTAYSDPWAGALLSILGVVGLKVLLPLWLVLRAFDLAFLERRRY